MNPATECRSLTFIVLTLTLIAAVSGAAAQDPLFPNTNAKDMDGDMPWRVQDADTPIPVLWVIKDADQFLVEVDEMKYVVLYDVSDGYDPPTDWDSPMSDHVVYFHDFGDIEISQGYWYWLTDEFENDGSYRGTMPDGTPLTAANLGYAEGDTISFTLRLYGKDGIWPFYTDVTLDRDLKVHVGEAPLPSLPGWFWGDVHNHGWKTDNLYEYGEPTDGKAMAAAAIGLSFVTITDHASDLSPAKWSALAAECAAYSTPSLRLIRGQEIHANQGGLGNVRHMLGYGLTDYVEGDEDGTFRIDEVLAGLDELQRSRYSARGAFAYAAHPSDPSLGWSYAELQGALAFDSFVGLEFFNERPAYHSTSSSSDDDDESHPWGGDASIDPYNRDWSVVENDWDDDLLQGLRDWDSLLSENLAPVRKLFLSGGSDSHGGWNYAVYRTDELDLRAQSTAMGKVRTAVHVTGALTDEAVLDSLAAGRSMATDGPAMIFGIDGDRDGALYGAADAILGDGPVEIAPGDPRARFRFDLSSSIEFGDVVCIRLLRGDASTGAFPQIVWESCPRSYGASIEGPAVSSVLPAVGETVYFRAEAYTYDPALAPPPPGDVSNASYDAVSVDYRYRCFTNPIWVRAVATPAHRQPLPGMPAAGR